MKISKLLLMCGASLLLTACATTQEALYQKAADGDAQSQLTLGLSLYRGDNGFTADKQQSLYYLEQAYAQGNAEAGYNLGLIYQADQHYPQARNYYQGSVQLGNVESLDHLAYLYKDGKGVEQDLNVAAQLALEAIDKGYQPSKRTVALVYLEAKQPDKAIDYLKQLLNTPTSPTNSAETKALSAVEMMEAYRMLKDSKTAYLWGSVALLATGFDSPTREAAQGFSHYQALARQLNSATKHSLASEIIAVHYTSFQRDEGYFQNGQFATLKPGVINPNHEQIVDLVSYFAEPNRDLFGTINQLKDKTDAQSKAQLAVSKLKLSNEHMKFAAVYLQTQAAKITTSEALAIIGTPTDPQMKRLQQLATSKLNILDAIYRYQLDTIKTDKLDKPA